MIYELRALWDSVHITTVIIWSDRSIPKLQLSVFIEQGKSEGFDSCDRPSNLAQIWSKSSIFQPVWPWNLMYDLEKIIGHLFYTTSSFVHHFKSIGEFKLKLHCGNAQFGSKSEIFLSLVTLKFDGWPWKIIGHLFYTTPNFVHHFKSISEFQFE